MQFARRIAVLVLSLLSLFAVSVPADALEAVSVPLDGRTLDLTRAVQLYRQQDDRIQVSTAPGADGIVRRIEVKAREANGGTSFWAVFALANNGDEQIDRLLVAPHFRLAGSGLFWPDLGASRIASITPSQGFAPDRQPSQEADVFRVTLDPGSVVTFVAELRTLDLPQLYLWDSDAYKDSVNSYTLYRGIVLGISGLLALFLTIVFVVKGTAMFPATAALAWSVLVYLCIDFGFWNRVINVSPGSDQVWRAGSEVFLAASLVIFSYTYLNLSRWHVRYSHLTIGWLIGLAILLGVAVIEPSVAAGIARFSIGFIAIAGFGIIVYLATHSYDRAIMLIPTWLLLLVWSFAAWLTVTGNLVNDVVQPALAGGLVLIVLLIGFTVMQHAFAGGVVMQGPLGDTERKALALTGAGDIVWDWDVVRDRIYTGPEAEDLLGLPRGTLEGPARDWLEILHSGDRDRFRTTLDTAVELRRGRIHQDFRLRCEDGHYRYFHLRARPVLGSDGEVLRCVGTLLDVTEERTSEERLLHDAVHDNLTGLPNRELFIDRLRAAITRTTTEGVARPSVFVLDIDRFKQINDGFGVAVGDFDPADHRAAPRPPAQAAGHAGAARRRPVRLPAHLREPAGAHRRLRRIGAPHAEGADHARREGDLPHRLDRHRHARRQAADRGRGPDQGRRDGHLPRQAAGRRPHRGVPAGAAPARQRPRDAGIGPPPGARPRGDQGALPADRAAGGQDHRRLRGAGALGPPQARPHPAERLRAAGRAHRAHHPARPVRARPRRRASSPNGRRSSAATPRSSSASTCRAGSSSATTSSTTSSRCWCAQTWRTARSSWR